MWDRLMAVWFIIMRGRVCSWILNFQEKRKILRRQSCRYHGQASNAKMMMKYLIRKSHIQNFQSYSNPSKRLDKGRLFYPFKLKVPNKKSLKVKYQMLIRTNQQLNNPWIKLILPSRILRVSSWWIMEKIGFKNKRLMLANLGQI